MDDHVKSKARLRFEPLSGRWVHYQLVPLFKRWRKPLRQWLSRRPEIPNVLLDDLAQEVFARLLRYNGNLEDIENPQGYVFRIAANIANEWAERAVVRKTHVGIESREFDDFERATAGDNPEDQEGQDMAKELIRAAVDALPRRQRQLIELHIWENLTYKQIAEQQKLTYRIVLRDLTRAYTTLRIHLKRDEL